MYQALISDRARSSSLSVRPQTVIKAFPSTPRHPFNYIEALSAIFGFLPDKRIKQIWETLNNLNFQSDALNVVWVVGSHTSILTSYLESTGLFTPGKKFSSNSVQPIQIYYNIQVQSIRYYVWKSKI